jgi:TIGR03009 family protein
MRHLHCRLNWFAVFVATLAIAWPGSAVSQTRPSQRVAQQPPAVAPAAGRQAPVNGPPAAANSGKPGAGPMVPITQNQAPAANNGPPAPAGADGQWSPAPLIVPNKPRQPFTLTAEQEKELDETLKKWEEKSDKIQSFKCELMRWDYDVAFGAEQDRFMRSESKGELKYKAPDHGVFHITSSIDIVGRVDGSPSEKKKRDAAELEHWVCDGESIFELNAKDKKLIQHKLPKEMRGKAISDGPLPFVFGAKADQIKKRYLMRVVTPETEKGKQVWLEAWPKFQEDAANYQRVQVILTDPEFVPYALQVFLPGGPMPKPGGPPVKDEQCSRAVYLFDKPVINDKIRSFLSGDFLPPMTPLGWKKVIDDPESEAPPTAATPAASPAAPQANRPASSKIR